MFDIFSPENKFLRRTHFFLKHFQRANCNCLYFSSKFSQLEICHYLKRDNPGNDCLGRVNSDRRTLGDVTICAAPQESHSSLLFCILFPSVADPGYLSRIPGPDFYPSRIPDLKSRIQKQQQKKRVKKKFCRTFLVATNFTKL
jgi:hypothetical protein